MARYYVLLLMFCLLGACTQSRRLPEPPRRFDPTVGAHIKGSLRAFWITRSTQGPIVSTIYDSTDSWGFTVPGEAWLVRTLVTNGEKLSQSRWIDSQEATAGEPEAVFTYYHNSMTKAATPGPYSVRGNQSDGYEIVKFGELGASKVASFPSRSIVASYFDGKHIIGQVWQAGESGDALIVDTTGTLRKFTLPAAPREVLTNGESIVCIRPDGATGFDLQGREIWHASEPVMPAKKPYVNSYIRTQQLITQQLIRCPHYACPTSTGFEVRQVSNNEIVASVDSAKVKGVYGMDNVLAVLCGSEVKGEKWKLYVFDGNKLICQKAISPTVGLVVVRSGPTPLIGWSGRVFDVVEEREYRIDGGAVCCIDSWVISIDDPPHHLYVTELETYNRSR